MKQHINLTLTADARLYLARLADLNGLSLSAMLEQLIRQRYTTLQRKQEKAVRNSAGKA